MLCLCRGFLLVENQQWEGKTKKSSPVPGPAAGFTPGRKNSALCALSLQNTTCQKSQEHFHCTSALIRNFNQKKGAEFNSLRQSREELRRSCNIWVPDAGAGGGNVKEGIEDSSRPSLSCGINVYITSMGQGLPWKGS